MTSKELQAIQERAERYSNYEDVAKLIWEISHLAEQLKDRETDLEFEYNSRIEAEQQLADLKDQLHTCESELHYEQLRRNAAEGA